MSGDMSRILVVDDEVVNRRILEVILRTEGFDPVGAADGESALAALSDPEIDLILLDVMMPGMSGFEVCRRIRGELGLAYLPVVFVSALGDRVSRIRGKDVGADDFLTKPVDDVELLVRVRSLVRLKRHHDEKERQRHLMLAILDSMGEGVVAVDELGRFTMCNPAAERLLGAHADMRASTDEEPGISITRALAGEALTDVAVTIRHPDPGQPAPLHLGVSSRPIEDSAGRRHGAVAVFRDMTRLIELDRFKEEMTSLLVHDLKNMIAVIRSSVEYALESVQGDPITTEALVDARDAGARGLRLLANLLDVTRLESNRLSLAPLPIEIAALFDMVSSHRTSQLRARGVALEISTGGVATVTADPDLLTRVMDNTLDNAARYTPAGGRIILAAEAVSGGRVQIRIGNSGPAIPAEYRETIFEKYGQTSPGLGKMNLGLGLYFCRLAVVAHGGRIWVESSAELPTIFAIELAGTRVACPGEDVEASDRDATLAS
jgi:signal transduction histidine kinase